METVIVTGAGGFLGRACCAALTAKGFEVRALVRNPQTRHDLQPWARGGIFEGGLPAKIDPAAFHGSIRAVVHCAFATTSHSPKKTWETNVEGTREIVRLATAAQARQTVFISSLASHGQAASHYGKAKWELEKLFGEPGNTIICPGTIIGNGGIFQRTREMIRSLPVVPILYGAQQLQTIDILDAAAGIVTAVSQQITGRLILAHPETVRLRDFYRSVAQVDGIPAKFISFPGDLALAAILAAERVGIRPPITSDNLLGIKHLHYVDPRESLERLALHPLNFADSIAAIAKNRLTGQN